MEAISRYEKLCAGMIAAVLIAFAFTETYQFGYSVARAHGDKALADYRASVEHESASAAVDAFGKYAADANRAATAESGYLINQSAKAQRAAALKDRIDHVVQSTSSAPAAAQRTDSPVGRCVFSRGFVSVWNTAAGIPAAGDHAMPPSSDSAVAAVGPDADVAADSGVSQADVLDWFVDYATRARDTESKLMAVEAALPKQRDEK